MFGLPSADEWNGRWPPPWPDAHETLAFANARSAMYALIKHLRSKHVWLPSYLCPSMPQAVIQAGVEPRYFEVTRHLKIESDSFLQDVQEGDLVVFIDYFGFPSDEAPAEAVKRLGAWVLEDASQALLSAARLQSADYVLLSPRKFVGVPDGGLLIAKPGRSLPSCELLAPPDEWLLCAVEAGVGRRHFDVEGIDDGWHDRYLRAKSLQPIGAFRMSDISLALLRRAFDWSRIASIRRSNYMRLLYRLHDLALFQARPPGVPLGSPIKTAFRAQVGVTLIHGNVFRTIHWRLEVRVPSRFDASLERSRTELTLICDQRFAYEEMEAVVERLAGSSLCEAYDRKMTTAEA